MLCGVCPGKFVKPFVEVDNYGELKMMTVTLLLSTSRVQGKAWHHGCLRTASHIRRSGLGMPMPIYSNKSLLNSQTARCRCMR